MKLTKLLGLALALLPTAVSAQFDEGGVKSFASAPATAQRQENVAEDLEPLARFTDEMGKIAVNNIAKAEQVFCYEVFARNADYDGYALEGYPIRGFCGILGDAVRDTVTRYFLSSSGYTDFDNAEQCVMQPKIILRFVRGVDYTDMLISSPCHSFALFYGGAVRVYNFKPGAEVIDALIKSVSEKHTEFVSPALLNQLLPIGVVQNEQQRQIVNKRSEPIRKWLDKAQKEEAAAAAEKEKNQRGWNKLKMRGFGN